MCLKVHVALKVDELGCCASTCQEIARANENVGESKGSWARILSCFVHSVGSSGAVAL